MRAIDADALLETMEKFFIKAEDEARYAGRRNAEVTWNDAVHMIKTAPTIEERKTGKWELIDDTEFRIPGYRCSVCHCECEDWENKPTYNFCPNCGAKLGEGEEE